jgi:nucleoside-diphosphate-sugar epimerase
LKVLLTGASGFVGSHILDALRSRDLSSAILLRSTSDRRFVARHLDKTELRPGSISDSDSLKRALKDVTHVIHCAGCTKASRNSEFYEINQIGTRNVVQAVNSNAGIQRLLHISSLAVTGPATASNPAHENDPCRPVSEYGKSKHAAEIEIREKCRVPFTILRPPAVYGPRDRGFLPMFKAVNSHILPRPGSRQALSLVYVQDLAGIVVSCLNDPVAAGKTYFVANPQVVTGRQIAQEIASQIQRWTVPLPLPAALLWAVCLGQELVSRVSGKAMLLNLQKYAELHAPGWVCSPASLKAELGCECPTALQAGVAQTLQWYKQNQWLR